MRNRGYPRRSGYKRVKDDFYVEPRWVVELILDVEEIEGEVLDPCCGTGTIPSVCLDRGINARGSDIKHRGFGEVRDLFTITEAVGVIISNIPYKNAEKYLRHMLILVRKKLIVILPLTIWESRRRDPFFRDNPPVRCWVCSDRPSMPPGRSNGERDHNGAVIQPESKGGTAPYCWLVFVPGFKGDTVIKRLPLRAKPRRNLHVVNRAA
jgi:hypothetical protein